MINKKYKKIPISILIALVLLLITIAIVLFYGNKPKECYQKYEQYYNCFGLTSAGKYNPFKNECEEVVLGCTHSGRGYFPTLEECKKICE